MMRSDELRLKYPVFRYERFEIEKTDEEITARFHFFIPPNIRFAPEVHFQAVKDGWHSIPDEFVNNVIFHLGLIEAFSYWKATASPTLEVLAGALGPEQIQWWQDLLTNGMGEYFYRNEIDFTVPDFVKIVSTADSPSKPFKGKLPSRHMLTIGGGRDSALAAGLLRESDA